MDFERTAPEKGLRFAGYAHLIRKFNLKTMPHWHVSFIAESGVPRRTIKDDVVEDIYPKKYWPGNDIPDHLEFALKYDGVNLDILSKVFSRLSGEEMAAYIESKPTGKYARRLWFLYEFLTGLRLPIDDIVMGNYTELLDPDMYFVRTPGEKIRRQRIVNNLLGTEGFCSVVRKSGALKELDEQHIRERCERIVKTYPSDMVRRALRYLYAQETKSSFEIEHIRPDASRVERFIALLESAERRDFCGKEALIELQNRIVDPRFADEDYRKNQNYVGQTVGLRDELIHYISPKPEDLPDLMEGLLSSHRLMREGNVPACVHAAVTAYGFVFLHPFEDGNGRIHRFLIHNILSTRGLFPKGLMLPVSADMLDNAADYFDSLEAFSRPLARLTEYWLNEAGRMTVLNDTADWYRYMDMTAQAEALYGFILRTIEEKLVSELDFLACYDGAKSGIQDIVDMPDRLIDLLIKYCLQNKGKLSNKKRSAYFDFLHDAELSAMEGVVGTAFGAYLLQKTR